jgi:hypothetical protein
VHWGGFASGEKQEPRISIALEYEARGSKKRSSQMPSFEHRLWLISAQILRYHSRFEKDVYCETQQMTAALIESRFEKEKRRNIFGFEG